MPESEFRKLTASSPGIGRVLEAFGLENKGRNHNTARKRIDELGIDISHFNHLKRARSSSGLIPLESILVAGSTYSPGSLKRRLISAGILKEVCAICSLATTWNELPLVLRFDHINGDSKDARLINLRLLCPNCDSQQSTFAGRNRNNPRHVRIQVL